MKASRKLLGVVLFLWLPRDRQQGNGPGPPQTLSCVVFFLADSDLHPFAETHSGHEWMVFLSLVCPQWNLCRPAPWETVPG